VTSTVPLFLNFFSSLTKPVDVMCLLQRLHSSDAARRHEYSLQESRRPDNRSRNRYRDVVPCEYILSSCVLQKMKYSKNGIKVRLVDD